MSTRLPSRSFIAFALLAALVPSSFADVHALAAPPTEVFAPVDCAEFGYAADVAPGEAVCGVVTVPLRHDAPHGATITLAVAVVKRSGTAAAATSVGTTGATVAKEHALATDVAPLILLQGGPGGSTIDAYMDLALAPDDDPFGFASIRRQRDIVLLDQRGTRYGRPALMCPELIELTRKTIELDLDADVSYALQDDAVADCRERLDDDGVDVAAFNSLENAADIPAVAAALGYARYDLYGVSYGSLLALHLMRLRPAGLESVILDGVVPPSVDFNAAAPTSLDGSLTALFDACAAAPDCRAAYPDLEAGLESAVARLDAEAQRVTVTDPTTGARYRAIVDGRSVIDAVHQLLYSSSAVPVVPYLIDAVSRGRYGALGEYMGLWSFDDSVAEGMYLSTVCSEDGDIDPEAVPLDEVRPWLADELAGDADDVLASCDIWDVPLFDASVDAPVHSDIPTLLLSGRFDPIAPASFADTAARTLTHAQHVVFPTGAHGALGDPCPNRLVAAFLADPSADVDAACAAEPKLPDFATPSDTLFSPVPRRLLGRLLPLTLVGDGADDTGDADGTDDMGHADATAVAPDAGGAGREAGEADGAGGGAEDDGGAGDAEAVDSVGDAAPRTLDGRDRPTAPGPLEALAPVLVLALAWFTLFTGAGAWALGRAFGAHADGRWPARLVGWLCAGPLVALPAFGAGLVIVLWRLVDSGGENVLYVGVPRGVAWLLWLPPFAGLCGVALLGVVVWAWRAGAWSVRRRLLATALGAAGLAVAIGVVWLGAAWPLG